MLIPDFKLWIGVVEDRLDPEQLGRYRVRILGYHTANKTSLPTTELPWAVPILPVTSAGVSGVMENPYLVEGSTVAGFFADSDQQVPIIMGSLAGIPLQKIKDPTVGFFDPNHFFPRNGEDSGYNTLGEPDTSRLSRSGAAEKHASLLEKRKSRKTEIPTAMASSVSSIGEDISGAVYNRATWSEPHPRFGSTDKGEYTAPGAIPAFAKGATSEYGYNRVTETESGHVFEIDDTPQNGRIHEYHNSGTFYEIQADGTKVTKIIGDEYEITLKNKKVFIEGSCDVTILGDAKLYVRGDKYEEVDGNVFTTVRGSRHTKIIGNDLTEIGTSFSTNITNDYSLKAGANAGITIGGDQSYSIGGDSNSTISGSSNSFVTKSMTQLVSGDQNNVTIGDATFFAGGNQSLVAGGTQNLVASVAQGITAPVQTTTIDGLQTTTTGSRLITSPTTSHIGVYSVTGAVSSTVSVTAPVVSGTSSVNQGAIVLGTHRHTIISGSSAGTTTTPI